MAAKNYRCRYPIADVTRALKEANGAIGLAAAALGMDRGALAARIARTPELNALYGDRDENDVVVPPTERDTLLRKPEDLPEAPEDPKLGLMVIETEKLIRDGLSTLGVPETTIAKLRAFDGLGVGAGRFLAQSMQDTHQIYYINLLKLDAMAEDIKRRYLDDTPDAVAACDPLQRMFWQRAYNEIVDQLGKGYDRMLSGTQAMVAMMRAKDGKGQTGNPKAKPGW